MRSRAQNIGILHGVGTPYIIHSGGVFQFPIAPRMRFGFEPVYLYEDELLVSGEFKSYLLGYRFFVELSFEILEAQAIREFFSILEEDEFTFKFAQDDTVSYSVRFASKELRLGYFKGKQLIHSVDTIRLESTRLLSEIRLPESQMPTAVVWLTSAQILNKGALSTFGVGCFCEVQEKGIVVGPGISVGPGIVIGGEGGVSQEGYCANFGEASDYSSPGY